MSRVVPRPPPSPSTPPMPAPHDASPGRNSSASSPPALWLLTKRRGCQDRSEHLVSPPAAPGPWASLNFMLRPPPQALLWRIGNPRVRGWPGVARWLSGRTSASLTPHLGVEPERQGGGRGAGAGGGRRPQARRSRSLGPARASRQHQGQLPGGTAAPDDEGARDSGARSPTGSDARLRLRAPRAGDWAGAARCSQGACPGVRSRGRSRSWQGLPLGTRSSPPASGTPQRPPRPSAPAGAAALPGAGAAVSSGSLPGTEAGRPVTCTQVLAAGAAPFPWLKVRTAGVPGLWGGEQRVQAGQPPVGAHLTWRAQGSLPGAAWASATRPSSGSLQVPPVQEVVDRDKMGSEDLRERAGTHCAQGPLVIPWHEGQWEGKFPRAARPPFSLLPGAKPLQ